MRILGIGSGDCSNEHEIGKKIWSVYHMKTHIVCFDPSPPSLKAALKYKRNHLKDDVVTLEVTSSLIKNTEMGAGYHGIFAHHALHHVDMLEDLFSFIWDAMLPTGKFVISDMIGRNGHRRWPEQLELADKAWSYITRRMDIYDYIDGKVLSSYPDSAYTCGNNDEGVRSQDILPLLVSRGFCFERFIGFGGIMHEFAGHRLERNFDSIKGRHLIKHILSMQEHALQNDRIKPDQMMAMVSKNEPCKRVYYQNASSVNSLRWTELKQKSYGGGNKNLTRPRAGRC